MKATCKNCNIDGVGKRSPHFKQRQGKCNLCNGLGWTGTYEVDYLIDK